MKPHRSLYGKILLWFFVNLIVIAVILLGFFNLRFRLGPNSPFGGSNQERILAIGHLMTREFNESPRENWDKIVESYSAAYKVDFSLLSDEGGMLAGKTFPIPREVMDRVIAPPRDRMPPLPLADIAPDDERDRLRPGPPPRPPEPPPHPTFSLRTWDPLRYWVGVRIPVFADRTRPPIRATLLAESDSMTGHGLFFDPTPWVVIAGVIISVSLVLWLPLARSITRPIARIQAATERIARGRFDVVLDEGRTDEIGRLCKSINEMSSRLEGYVKGQKRFLGDVAHELASPIARMQLGLGILDQRVDDSNRDHLQGVIQEVRHMSDLVNELLSFSRAEVNPAKVKLESVPVARVAQRVLEREGADGVEIRTEINGDLQVTADPELLARALGNVVRNAVRYAGTAGPIDISARREGDEIAIEVRDSGKGVPEESLGQLFEPFYRPEPSRGRETGGVGLGLAIVRTCVQACQGAVNAKNLRPVGFAVTMTLKAANL